MRRAALALACRFGFIEKLRLSFIWIHDQLVVAEHPDRLCGVAGVVDVVDVAFEFVFPLEGGAAVRAVEGPVV